MKLSFHPLTPDRWADFAKLFGPRGGCAGCWCMYPRLRGPEYKAGSGDGNRRAMQRIVKAGKEPGILAYAGGEAVGWCALAPRETYPRILASRLLQPIDERPVWAVVCFFIAKEWRRKGLTSQLLEAGAEYARDHGATLLEGYPYVPKSRKSPDAFAWFGVPASFENAGFEEVARPSASRRIMRRELKPAKRRTRTKRG